MLTTLVYRLHIAAKPFLSTTEQIEEKQQQQIYYIYFEN